MQVFFRINSLTSVLHQQLSKSINIDCKSRKELYFSCTSPNLVTMSIKHCQIANNVLVCSYIHVYIMTNFMDLWLFLPH